MEYIVEFIGHDGKVRHTKPMSKIGAELAACIVPFETRIVPSIETAAHLGGELTKEGNNERA